MSTSTKSDSFLINFILSSPQRFPIWRSNRTVATATGLPWEHWGFLNEGTLVSFEYADWLFSTLCKSWTSIESTDFSYLLVWISISTLPLSRHRGTPFSWFLEESKDSHLGKVDLPFSTAWKQKRKEGQVYMPCIQTKLHYFLYNYSRSLCAYKLVSRSFNKNTSGKLCPKSSLLSGCLEIILSLAYHGYLLMQVHFYTQKRTKSKFNGKHMAH